MKKFLFLLLVLILGGTSTAFAQVTADINLVLTPMDPQPGQKVTITAESYAVNLDQARISWTYAGKTIDGGIGRKSITVTTPAAGTTTTITMTASGSDFSSTTSTLILRPASIDLLWEAVDSYTPPFYKGKALGSVNSTYRVTAVPTASAPKQLVYNWSRDNTAQASLSGYGKSSLLFKNSELDPTEIVGVTAEGGAFTGSGGMTLVPGNPSLVVYKKNEGFIDYANGASNALSTNDSGLILRIEPFFFSVPTTIAKNLVFNITEGDVDITNTTNQNELYLSAPSSKGTALFNIGISTLTYSLQRINRAFNITFL